MHYFFLPVHARIKKKMMIILCIKARGVQEGITKDDNNTTILPI